MMKPEDLLAIEMPFDIGAEQAVIGSILVEPETIELVREKLQGGEFYDKIHARIYRAMVQLNEEGIPVDPVSVSSKLKERNEIDDIGGPSYLLKLAGSVPSVANVGHYADLVYDVFIKRQAIETAAEMLRLAASQQDIVGFVAMAEAAVSRLSDQAAPAKEFHKIKDVLMDVWDAAEKRYNNRNLYRGITGIPSGFDDLDRMTSGFQKSDLIIVAARPSVGKTAFALNIAQNVAIRIKESVAIFSLEMSASQLVQRMVCAEGNVDASRMRTGFFDGDDWVKMSHAVGALSSSDLYIDDTPGITANEIRSKCRRLKKEKGLGLILIDYIQLITAARRGANRQEEVSEISRTLKQIARELEVPVIALSQLSRGVEQRQDKRPMMSDLRESGAIEQDADIVAFLYRDDYYDKESEKKNIIEIIIAKQRNGPVGTVELAFLKNFNKFVSLDRSHAEADSA